MRFETWNLKFYNIKWLRKEIMLIASSYLTNGLYVVEVAASASCLHMCDIYVWCHRKNVWIFLNLNVRKICNLYIRLQHAICKWIFKGLTMPMHNYKFVSTQVTYLKSVTTGIIFFFQQFSTRLWYISLLYTLWFLWNCDDMLRIFTQNLVCVLVYGTAWLPLEMADSSPSTQIYA